MPYRVHADFGLGSLPQAMDGADTGGIFKQKHVRYYKCEAVRYTPLHPKGFISVDGERTPFGPVQVEVHRGAGRVLSLTGRLEGRRPL